MDKLTTLNSTTITILAISTFFLVFAFVLCYLLNQCRKKKNKEHRELLELQARKANARKEVTSLNIVIIGDSGIGKTTLMRRFDKRTEKAKEQYPVSDSMKDVYLSNEGREVKVKLWDSKSLQTLDSQFYHQADGIMIAFDLTNQRSFDICEKWI